MSGVPAVVGVCTLTTRGLATRLRSVPGVAIAAPLMTANLGIEELVRSVLRRPSIQVLVVCGRDSPLFGQGQSLVALVRSGIGGSDHRIAGALGYRPCLRGLRRSEVDAFRARIRLMDLRGVLDPVELEPWITELAGMYEGQCKGTARPDVELSAPRFRQLRPVGRRWPILAAGKGFFVVSVDSERREVVLRHYGDDFSAGYEMRGRRAESMILGVIGAGLVGELGHAGYLGAELAKAETALRLGLDYVQDTPVRRPTEREEQAVHSLRSLEEFTRYLGTLLEVGELAVEPDKPLDEQFTVDSARLIELAIALEQDCGVELPDDIDLRRATPAELYRARAPAGEAN